MGTKNNPGAFDCYANAHPDEPMFILLGRDKFAASLVEMWAAARETAGEDPAKVQEACDCADAMRECSRALGKTPEEVLAWIPFDAMAEELRRRGATVTAAAMGANEDRFLTVVLEPVDSSQISAVGHCPVSNILAIQFKAKDGPGSIYHYRNFTVDLFEQFKNAPSIGAHFGKNIKPFADKFPYVKVS
jgi:hypothetical protein